jgi:phage/plasmid primase-like uncharacterized protein
MKRTSIDYVVQTVKDSVSALEAGQALGLDPNRDGRCRCPMHGGTDRNLKLYSDRRGYYCFVCHEQGDVITLVRKVNGRTFAEAVQWLSDAFRLGVDTNTPISDETRQRAKKRAETRKKLDALHKDAEQGAFDTYLNAAGLVTVLDRMAADHRPTDRDAPFKQSFIAAMRYGPEARWLLEQAECLMMEGT